MGFMRRYANAHASGMIRKTPDIPDNSLMVGSSEIMATVPVVLYKKAVPPAAVPLVEHFNNMSHEDIHHGLMEGSISYEDFPGQSLFMGNPTEDL